MIDWCAVLVWLPTIGLLVDALGVFVVTVDILPDFNRHRADLAYGALEIELERHYQSGLDASRGPADPQFGYSTERIGNVQPDRAAEMIAHSQLPFDFER